jgi:1-deoxy-D-xylulose-5-phosphate synthase
LTPLPIGKGEVLNHGDDLLLIAVGSTVGEAVCAAALLEENHDVRATVINARFIKPLDKDLIIPLARNIHRIITVEENTVQGGFGSAVLELLSDNDINDTFVKRMGINDHFVEHGPQDTLRCKYQVDASAIIKTALSMIKG